MTKDSFLTLSSPIIVDVVFKYSSGLTQSFNRVPIYWLRNIHCLRVGNSRKRAVAMYLTTNEVLTDTVISYLVGFKLSLHPIEAKGVYCNGVKLGG